MNRSQRAVAALALGGLPAVAMAQLDPGDIRLDVENGQIVTSLIGEGGGAPVPQRVFLAEIGVEEFEPGDGTVGSGGSEVFQLINPDFSAFSTNTPGFDSPVGEFAAGTNVGFELTQPFSVFDQPSDSFVPSDDPLSGTTVESLLVEFNLTLFQTNAAEPGIPVSTAFPGGGLPVFSNGRFHRHFAFTLLPINASETATLADPGVYALIVRMTSTDSAVEASEPIVLLFPFGVAETSQEFIDAQNAALALTSGDPLDFNGDGSVDIADLVGFLNDFFGAQADPALDFNGDGSIDIADVVEYLNAFFASP